MISKDIKQRRGSKKSLQFEFAGNLTGCEISFVVKPSTEITDIRVVDKNSSRPGEIEVTYNNSNNKSVIKIDLLEEDTYSLKADNYYYDLDNLSASATLAGGMFMISADVQTPFDNLDILPRNCSRVILAMPDEFEDNTLIYKITEGGEEKFEGITEAETKTRLGIVQLENNKVDKEAGKGLSEVNLTSQMKGNYDTAFSHTAALDNPHNVTKNQIGLSNVTNTDTSNPANINQNSSYRFVTDGEKGNWNSAFTDRHSHANKSTLDTINQGLSTSAAAQFNQLALGRAVSGTWSLAAQSGITTKTGTFIDWEGGNARFRETAYNFEFSNFDGTNLILTFKMGGSGNYSFKPLSTNGQSYKTSSVSANTVLTSQEHCVLVTTSSSDKTITLPIAGINDGTVFFVKKIDSGSGKVIIQGASGTIDGQNYIEINSQYTTIQLLKSGSSYFILGRCA